MKFVISEVLGIKRQDCLKFLTSMEGLNHINIPGDILQIKMLKSLFEHYCDIDNIREAELSTVWNEIEECHHIRDEYEKLDLQKISVMKKFLYMSLFMLFLLGGDLE